VRKRFTAAFSLVEVTLAIGIAAFCLIAVFGLMPVGVQTNRNATSQTGATNIIPAVVADLRATPKAYNNSKTYYVGDSVWLSGNCYRAIAVTTGNQPPNSTYWTGGSPCPQFGTSSQFGISFGTPKTLYFDSAGQASTSLTANSRYRLDITWNSAPTGLRYADLRVSWPAPVDPATTTPSGSVETFAAFDRN
jgi:hypothetical protein